MPVPVPPTLSYLRSHLVRKSQSARSICIPQRTRERPILNHIDDKEFNFVYRNRYSSRQLGPVTISGGQQPQTSQSFRIRALPQTQLHRRVESIERAVQELSMRVHRNNIKYIGGDHSAFPSTPLIRMNYLNMLLRRKACSGC